MIDMRSQYQPGSKYGADPQLCPPSRAHSDLSRENSIQSANSMLEDLHQNDSPAQSPRSPQSLHSPQSPLWPRPIGQHSQSSHGNCRPFQSDGLHARQSFGSASPWGEAYPGQGLLGLSVDPHSQAAAPPSAVTMLGRRELAHEGARAVEERERAAARRLPAAAGRETPASRDRSRNSDSPMPFRRSKRLKTLKRKAESAGSTRGQRPRRRQRT